MSTEVEEMDFRSDRHFLEFWFLLSRREQEVMELIQERPSARGAVVFEPQEELLQITEAFRRMSDGTYGVCSHCGCRIASSSLWRDPYARYCQNCWEI